MDPVSAIASAVGSIVDLFPKPTPEPVVSTQQERIDWYLSQRKDNTQTYILAGIGVIILALVLVILFKKKS